MTIRSTIVHLITRSGGGEASSTVVLCWCFAVSLPLVSPATRTQNRPGPAVRNWWAEVKIRGRAVQARHYEMG